MIRFPLKNCFSSGLLGAGLSHVRCQPTDVIELLMVCSLLTLNFSDYRVNLDWFELEPSIVPTSQVLLVGGVSYQVDGRRSAATIASGESELSMLLHTLLRCRWVSGCRHHPLLGTFPFVKEFDAFKPCRVLAWSMGMFPTLLTLGAVPVCCKTLLILVRLNPGLATLFVGIFMFFLFGYEAGRKQVSIYCVRGEL
jgi:hypothetical protein